MTGYGRAKKTLSNRDITVEVRSVNNRYLDCTVKLPRAYIFAEDAIKGRVQKAISRGKVDVFVTIDSTGADEEVVVVNEGLARSYLEALRKLYEIDGGNYLQKQSYAADLARIPDVLTVTKAEEDLESVGADICEVLDEESDLHNPDSPIYDVPDGSVDFENVSFKYSAKADRMALENINLHIPSGQTVGIIGGTGSSKTSLIQLISRLYDATEGRVLVGGHDVRDYDLESLRNQVAVVLQKNVLFSGTIKENLRWGDENATDEDLVRVCRLAQADEFIQTFPDKYDTYIEQGGTNVSGGQKQRLCIARALLKKPKVLILDDSTSAVDTKTDALIRQAMREEIPDTTKFIIAQRISSVQDADLILVMNNGRIESSGTHEELLKTSTIYKEVYDSQNKAGGENHG